MFVFTHVITIRMYDKKKQSKKVKQPGSMKIYYLPEDVM